MQHFAKPVNSNNFFILSRNTESAKTIQDTIGVLALKFVKRYINIEAPNTEIVSGPFDINSRSIANLTHKNIIHLKSLNKKDLTDSYCEYLNKKISLGGIFIGRIDGREPLKEFQIKKNTNPEKWYKRNVLGFRKRIKDLISLKFFSNDPIFRKKIQLYGRLAYLGLEIISESVIGHFQYFVAKRTSEISLNPKPTSFPIIKLRRIGKTGKLITIYKIRTMYPYSEYIQDYIYKNNNLEPGGKFKDDERISRIGNFFRKYWIDELPMVINLIKGDIKIFGVRPLSCQYFNLYPEELRQLRTKYKPGLIPPYYSDMPTSFEEIIDSEYRYLKAFEDNPLLTDLKYLAKALYNIIIRSKRSK